jgi:hypothetical protein
MNCSCAGVAPRSARIEGSAMLTMKKSRKERNDPIKRTGSARHRRGSRPAVSFRAAMSPPGNAAVASVADIQALVFC